MRIRFSNGLVFGSGEYQLVPPIQGLDTPAMRNGNSVYAGVDGGYMISQYYGMRTIVLKGFFMGCVADLRQNLLSKLYMRYYMPVTIEDNNKQCWHTDAYISDIKCDYTSPTAGEFQITLLCPDPLFYKASSFTSDTPVVIENNLTVNGETVILRQGDSDVSPIIELTGEFTNPVITIGSAAFGLGLTTDNSSKITIDMKNKTVKALDGTSLAEYRLIDSKWLHLSQGANEIIIETENNSDTGTAKLKYSAGYRGI